MYRWELDGLADQEFAALHPAVQATLAAFMDAVVIVDPIQYQRRGSSGAMGCVDAVCRPLLMELS